MLTDMVELLQDGGAMGMHRFGDLAEMRDNGIVAVAKVTASQYCGGVHRHRLDYDHRRTAARAFFVVGAMALARQTHIGHVGGMGTEYYAIVEFAMAHLERLKNTGIVSHGDLRHQLKQIVKVNQ